MFLRERISILTPTVSRPRTKEGMWRSAGELAGGRSKGQEGGNKRRGEGERRMMGKIVAGGKKKGAGRG